MPESAVPLNFNPGLQRDGTALDSTRYLDALWTRWRLGRPRKMGGYKRITNQVAAIPRRIHLYYAGNTIIAHIGTSNGIQQVVFDINGNVISVNDRTPAAFQGGPNIGWTIDAIFDTTSSVVQIVAHGVADLLALANPSPATPFIGELTATSKLSAFTSPNPSSGTWTQPNVAGGIVCVQPYLFDYDANGFVGWSAPNLPGYLGVTGGSTGAGSARVSAQKIIAGMPLRGGASNTPAAIFWSLSEVIVASFIGSPAFFAFNTLSPSSSILASDAVIEYDGLYFWPGVDRFLVFNGTTVEVPNGQNQDWFFNNLTPGLSAKTFAFKIPRYGEIWFCAPMFGNTEPSHAAIYNIRENYWYDTQLPADFRTCGYFAQGFPTPIMGSAVPDTTGYKLWMHETGNDAVDGNALSAIRSYFETPAFAGPKLDPPDDHGYSLAQLEPDFVQTGDMTVTPTGAFNARSGEFAGQAVPIPATPQGPQDQLASFKFERRLPRLHFESNTLGGSYISGRHVLHGQQGDSRRTGGSTSVPPVPQP
jgi:hypothetical protein